MTTGRTTALLERLALIGARPEDSSEERSRAGALILASIAIAAISFLWIGIYVAYGYYRAAAIPFAYQVITLTGLLVLSRAKRFDLFCTTELTMWLLLPPLLQLSLGGFVASSGMVLWSILVPFAAVALMGVRRAVPWLVAFFAILIGLAAVNTRVTGYAADFSEPVQIFFIVVNIAGVTLGGFLLLGYFVDRSERNRVALAEERERSEALLRNVLPASIAERLKRHEGVIAERFDEVSVLFADIEGFTARSQGMEPEQLVVMLDRIFSAFDALADAEGLEKIKTIGDAYMVVGGAPVPRADHAEAIARVALAMREAIARLAADDLEGLGVRIGIDTGPVVAGVIGTHKFIYDVWGDTVNLASRMESLGVPGRVQVSRAVMERLSGDFRCESRGLIDVKGMGPTPAYFVVDRVADAGRIAEPAILP
jgi:adenylate cyclase